MLARRKFLKSSLIFTASAFLLCGNPKTGFGRGLLNDGPLSDEVLKDPLLGFTKETFEPYLGDYFISTDARGETVPLKLVKVEAYAPKSETKLLTRTTVQTESFVLEFDAEGALPQFKSIYHIKHGALGEFNIFLTRRDGPSVITYEAVFNRLI